MPEIIKITNCYILKNHQILKEDLWVSNGKICDPQATEDRTINAKGLLISPGYIDIQINGAFGVDFFSDPQSIHEVTSKILKFGVTSILPTLITATPESYSTAIPALQPRPGSPTNAEILGIHLEGPFINQDKHGAHQPNWIRSSPEGIKNAIECYGSLEGVKMVTLAPEIEGGELLISELRQKGIVVSAGHSRASYQQSVQALQNGLSSITHLFNAMEAFHHREPGLIGAALSRNTHYFSIIADGFHVHPAAVEIAWRSNPDKLILISDAASNFGAESGEGVLAGERIINGINYATREDGKTMAGSNLALDQMVRNLRTMTNCSVVEALEAATLHPAKLLEIQNRKGSLDTGCDADLIFLDHDLNVMETHIIR